MSESQIDLENSLNQTGIFPKEYVTESHDFIRLLKRLAAISKLELNLDFPKGEDQELLGAIDKLLSVIDCPLANKLFIPFPHLNNKNNNSNDIRTDRRQYGNRLSINRFCHYSIQTRLLFMPWRGILIFRAMWG